MRKQFLLSFILVAASLNAANYRSYDSYRRTNIAYNTTPSSSYPEGAHPAGYNPGGYYNPSASSSYPEGAFPSGYNPEGYNNPNSSSNYPQGSSPGSYTSGYPQGTNPSGYNFSTQLEFEEERAHVYPGYNSDYSNIPRGNYSIPSNPTSRP